MASKISVRGIGSVALERATFQHRTVRQSSGARRAALDLQTRAADPHGNCCLAIWTAGAGQKSAALGYGQALEVPVQRTIVGGIRSAVVPAPDNQPSLIVDARQVGDGRGFGHG